MPDPTKLFDFDGEECIARERERALTLTVTTACSTDFIRHVADTRFGTAGVRYRRLDVEDQLGRLPSPVFVELRRGDTLVGTYALATTPLRIGDASGVGVYRGLLSVTDAFKRRGLGLWLVENTLEWLADVVRHAEVPVVSWGCIEAGNRNSLELLRSLGAQPLGDLRSTLIYRQWPRPKIGIERLSPEEERDICMERQRVQSDCTLSADGAGDDDYLVCRSDGVIAAGARVRITRLCFDTLGSRWDALYRHLLRYAAPARRRFDPENFTYVRFSDILFKPKYASVWNDFASSILHRYGTHMGLFILDERQALYSQLAQAGIFGRFGQATGQTLHVLGQTWNAEPELESELRAGPLGVGPLDM